MSYNPVADGVLELIAQRDAEKARADAAEARALPDGVTLAEVVAMITVFVEQTEMMWRSGLPAMAFLTDARALLARLSPVTEDTP